MKALALLLLFVLFTGCSGSLGNIAADSPIERGLSYIACAIVTHAIIQALCNK